MLPEIKHTIFVDNLIADGKEVKYRAFSIEEEKILLTAEESRDPRVIFEAIRRILDACVVSHDVDDLAVFDCERLLMLIRSVGVDDVAKFRITDPDTNEKVDLTINVKQMEVFKSEGHSKKIKVSDDMTITMRYPSMSDLMPILTEKIESRMSVDMVLGCIESVAMGDEIFTMKDVSDSDKIKWASGLDKATLVKMKEFIDTMPVVRYVVPYQLEDGTVKSITIQGIKSFFG